MLSFKDQELENLDWPQKEKLRAAVDSLVGYRTATGDLRLMSQISNEHGENNYILIGARQMMVIPGGSELFIQLFDSEGKLLNSIEFGTGWRIDLTKIGVKYSPEIKREIIEVSSEKVINGRDVAKQYYTLLGKNILLLRLEDSRGLPVRNVYGAFNMMIGSNLMWNTAGEYAKALESSDPGEILAALTWLNGIHWNPRITQDANYYENMEEAETVEKIRSNSDVKGKIKKLLQSENPWVKEAAKMAGKTEYYD